MKPRIHSVVLELLCRSSACRPFIGITVLVQVRSVAPVLVRAPCKLSVSIVCNRWPLENSYRASCLAGNQGCDKCPGNGHLASDLFE